MGEEKVFTGKYGRGQFIEESEKAFDMARLNKTHLSVIQLDLDMFHNLNQTYGYEIGDIVLERTQAELVAVLQESNHKFIIDRRGGDEFSITIETNTLFASKLASKLLNRVLDVDYSDVAEKLKVSITAGIAELTKKTESYSELVHDATIALYKAKKEKR